MLAGLLSKRNLRAKKRFRLLKQTLRGHPFLVQRGNEIARRLKAESGNLFAGMLSANAAVPVFPEQNDAQFYISPVLVLCMITSVYGGLHSQPQRNVAQYLA